MPNRSINIMIAEDHHLVRDAFVRLLNGEKNLKVIGDAGNGKELLELIKNTPPDIALLDIDMPIMNGKETLGIIKKRFPGIKVIMLSMYVDTSYMSEFMALGADAYLSKNCDPVELIKAIKEVKTKGKYFNEETSKALLQGLQKEKKINPLFDELAISEREKEIMLLLCDGKTSKEIAEQLHISANTVDFHRANIYSKTKSKNIAELVKYAIKNGIIDMN